MDMNQNLANLMKEAQKMQQRMQDAQAKLAQTQVTGEAGGGMVKVVMNGRHDVVKVTLHPSLMDEDAEMIADLFAAATNDAVRKVEKTSQEEIAKLTSGLNLPTELLKDQK